MADGTVIIDTGPLVAYLVRRDSDHEWAVTRFKQLQPPFLTCQPVLAETAFLVQRVRADLKPFFDFIRSGIVATPFDVLEDSLGLAKLIAKYSQLPMSLADACLVRLAEQHPKARVFTLDQHFRLYRRNGRQVIATIMPSET